MNLIVPTHLPTPGVAAETLGELMTACDKFEICFDANGDVDTTAPVSSD